MLDPRVLELYRSCPKLRPEYIRDVLNLTGERAEAVATITGGIHREEAELLARMTDEIDPVRSLEVGLGYGFSALTVCTSGKRPVDERHHIVIDPHQSTHWDGAGMRHIEEAGFATMVELREEPSYRVLPQLERDRLEIDLAFIDGWHTYDFVFVDFFFVDKLLCEGGVVVFDDADWPSIRPVIRYAVTNLSYEVAGTLTEKGEREPCDVELGLQGSCIALRKTGHARDREIFFHEPFQPAPSLSTRTSIDGVLVKPLRLLRNERGQLMEVQRRDDDEFKGFGQAYVTQSFAGVVKAWYRHRVQTDQVAVVTGTVKLVLYDDRADSRTHGQVDEIMMGDSAPRLVVIPSGVWHGFQAVGETSAFLLHLNSEPYRADDPDEERLDPDDPSIPYAW